MKIAIYTLTVIIVSSMGCNNLNPYQKMIKNARSVLLYEVDMLPTEPNNQTQGKTYIADYNVLDSIPLTQKQVLSLKKTLVNTLNYSTENGKRCPFLGKYAIQIDTVLTCIVGIEPCPKISVNTIGNAPMVYDLAKDSNLEKTLRTIATPQ